MLTWSLVVCTLNRREILRRALRTALSQTRPPRQIIVVDASADWERCRDDILGELASEAPQVEWIYEGSSRRSLTHQRNVGIRHVTSPVSFLLDDDSLMYPDCAAEVMRVYEADRDERIGGVMAALAEAPPDASEHAPAPPAPGLERATLLDAIAQAALPRVGRWWHLESLFIPYDGVFHRCDDAALEGLGDVEAALLFSGCRMTYRTEILRQEGGFEEALIRGAVAEDCDMSYRVSRRRALVLAKNARICHLQTEVERASRRINAALGVANAAALYLLNTEPSAAGRRTVYSFALRRLALETIRGCAKPARRFAHARGAWHAVKLVGEMLAMNKAELRSGYPRLQEEIYAARG